ncbi:MAG: response regulator transcription factor [Clostridium sp.]
MTKILIVEDDKSILDLLELTLKMENYIVTTAEDGEIAFNLIQKNLFDLIVLDIMLPKMDGFQLINKIKYKNIPVIFLSAKTLVQDKILGLKLGADDYLTKPFEPLELLARIEAILRRNRKPMDNSESITFHHLSIYPNERLVKIEDTAVYLTMKEYELLMVFIDNINNVLSRDVLLNKIWGYDFYGETRTVDMHVKQIRDKLRLKDYLQTIYKVGYILKN